MALQARLLWPPTRRLVLCTVSQVANPAALIGRRRDRLYLSTSVPYLERMN